jgi:predicted branched-subunit amino acid permease
LAWAVAGAAGVKIAANSRVKKMIGFTVVTPALFFVTVFDKLYAARGRVPFDFAQGRSAATHSKSPEV